MFYLFLLLTFLVILEASTSLSRLSGYLNNFPEGGLILQSSLSLLSRMAMFLFLPFLGYLSDKDQINTAGLIMPMFSLLFPLGLFFLLLGKVHVTRFYSNLINRVRHTGSFFTAAPRGQFMKYKLKYRKIKTLRYFFVLVAFSYIPYYLAWPLIIFLLDVFNDSRGMILGLSSMFNGINTIILTMYIDPKLIRFGRYKRLSSGIYTELVKMRIMASLCSSLLLLFIVLAIGN